VIHFYDKRALDFIGQGFPNVPHEQYKEWEEEFRRTKRLHPDFIKHIQQSIAIARSRVGDDPQGYQTTYKLPIVQRPSWFGSMFGSIFGRQHGGIVRPRYASEGMFLPPEIQEWFRLADNIESAKEKYKNRNATVKKRKSIDQQMVAWMDRQEEIENMFARHDFNDDVYDAYKKWRFYDIGGRGRWRETEFDLETEKTNVLQQWYLEDWQQAQKDIVRKQHGGLIPRFQSGGIVRPMYAGLGKKIQQPIDEGDPVSDYLLKELRKYMSQVVQEVPRDISEQGQLAHVRQHYSDFITFNQTREEAFPSWEEIRERFREKSDQEILADMTRRDNPVWDELFARKAMSSDVDQGRASPTQEDERESARWYLSKWRNDQGRKVVYEYEDDSGFTHVLNQKEAQRQAMAIVKATRDRKLKAPISMPELK
jgi:hypothetical protein